MVTNDTDHTKSSRRLLILLCLFGIMLLPSNQSSSFPDSHGRLNTKHLSKLFKRFSAFVQPQTTRNNHHDFLPATIDSRQDGKHQSITGTQSTSKAVQYRQIEPNFEIGNFTDFFDHSHEEKVTLSNETLSMPSLTTASYRSMETTSTVSPAAAFLSSTTLPELDNSNYITAPTDQCKCVCRNGFKLETHDIRLEELKMKLLQAELLSENKSTQNMPKIEDVLDSLVDEDESDYDDVDELEQVQKPAKYIPMEIIELSHRRPPRKPNQSGGTTSTSSTTTPYPLLPTTHEPPSTAPLYSMSFTKPVSTIKFLATRVAQLGIPLLMTVALGNALTQIEMIDRSSSEDNHRDNFTGSPMDYWNMFQMPFASHGYYGPFYDSIPPVHLVPESVPKEGKTPKKKKKFKWTKTKKPGREWSDRGSVLKRWIDRLRY